MITKTENWLREQGGPAIQLRLSILCNSKKEDKNKPCKIAILEQ